MTAVIAANLSQRQAFWKLRDENVGSTETRRRLDHARHFGAGRRGARFHRGSQCRGGEN